MGLNSRAYILWDNSLGRVVSEAEANTPVPVASLTKIMTALITLEQRELAEEVTITPEMLAGLEEFSIIGLQVGQVATVEDLLYATLLPSAGDAAQALAISTSGSMEDFVTAMNARAAGIGMQSTHFSNPVGMDADNYSTPADIVLLLREALRNPEFVTIFNAYERELTSVGLTARKTFAQAEPIIGGKTGYTNAAGRCLASTAEVEGMEYILVTVGAPTEGTLHLADTKRIYQAVEENYEPVQLVTEGDVLAKIPVRGSLTEALEFRAFSDFVVALPNDFRVEDLTYSVEDFDGRPMEAISQHTETGEPFGAWIVRYRGEKIYEQELTIWKDCHNESQGQYCVEQPWFYGYGGVILVVIATLVFAGTTVAGFWRKRKQTPKSKVQKVAPWVGLAMTLVSLTVCVLMLWDCFGPAKELEVYQPEPIYPEQNEAPETPSESEEPEIPSIEPTDEVGGNCTTNLGNLMLINPNFTVGSDFIAARRSQLISVSQTYGIPEYHAAGNGDNLMIPEAAAHLNEMIEAYKASNPGHEIGTYSCFRAVGTSCGRLCAATGTSDHHTGLTCDLIDLQYGSVLDTDDYPNHREWQWLRENSYKYGFIDRFPEAWAGGSMSEPLNVDENGSTGLFETWHYRYVGIEAATDIATGKYNNGHYDSLEHYLKATGKVNNLKTGTCF